jgi:integrase
MLLALAGGLRRGEIDSLAWHQIDFEHSVIRIEPSETANLKTADSRGEVPIDPGIVPILRGFRAKATGPFVIEAEGGEYGPRVWGRHYRADAVFTRLNMWLRKHGVTARKPIHELRKELGSLLTEAFGIYVASRILRHSTVATTAAHYSDLKSRPSVAVSTWLLPANATALPTQSSRKPTRNRRRAP